MTMAPVKSPPVSDETTGDVDILLAAAEDAVSNYLSSPSPEHIHQLRITCRRLSATLKLMENKPETAQALAEETKWLMDAVSSARDADVLAETINERMQKFGDEFSETLKPLSLALKNTANLQRGRAARSLQSSRYEDLVKDLTAYTQVAEAIEGPSETSSKHSGSAASVIKKSQRRLRKLAKRAKAERSPEAAHEMRLATKKLRYELEAANTGPNSKYVKRRVKELIRLQDKLGEARDFHLAAKRTEELAERNAKKWDQVSISNAAKLAADLRKQAAKRTAGASKLFDKHRGSKPKSRLRKTLKRLRV